MRPYVLKREDFQLAITEDYDMARETLALIRHTRPRTRARLVHMGFNPHHQYKRKRADLPIVIIALLVVAALLVWGFAG